MANRKDIENLDEKSQLKLEFNSGNFISINKGDNDRHKQIDHFMPRTIPINSREHIYKSILNRRME